MSLTGSTAPRGTQSIPRLAEPFELAQPSNPRSEADEKHQHQHQHQQQQQQQQQHKKRGIFGFGKKKADDTAAAAALELPQPQKSGPGGQTINNIAGRRSTTSPVRGEHASPQNISMMPSSPHRALSSSPRLSSPAGSQIFERDVQESALPIPNSPAIPSHIQTENYIPPVLDASSEAITDDHLDPDSVEIVTHTSHQPAMSALNSLAGAATSSNNGDADWADELAAAFAAGQDGAAVDSASNYGSLDTTDVRRLSFISFADVVQAEHQQQAGHGGIGSIAGTRDSIHLAGLTSLSSNRVNRSPSPIRSPVSSAGGGPGTSPPTSKSGSVKGIDLSPSRKPLGSPTTIASGGGAGAGGSGGGSNLMGGELNIQTMAQALRRTGSSDLSAVRSFPASPI